MCKNQLNIKDSDIAMLFDKTAIEIKDKYKKFLLNSSKEAAENYEIAQYFIYYTGHGRIVGTNTMGVDQDNCDIDLEKMIRDIAVRKN